MKKKIDLLGAIKVVSKSPRQINMSDYDRTSDKKGSNTGGFFQDKISKKEFYIKWLPEEIQEDEKKFFNHADLEKGKYKNRHRNRFNNEILALRIYELYGLKVPKAEFITYVDENGKRFYGISSEKAENVKPLKEAVSKPEVFAEIRAKAQEGFLIDVLLSNYDVVGWSMDNMHYDPQSNEPFRLDPGAALRYYATGKAKKGEFDKTEVGEFDDMVSGRQQKTKFNPNTLRDAGKVFGGIYESPALLISLKKLLSITDEQLSSCVDANGFNIAEDKEGKGVKKNIELIEQLVSRKNVLIIKAEKKIIHQLMTGLQTKIQRMEYLTKAGIAYEDIDKICSSIEQGLDEKKVIELIRSAIASITTPIAAAESASAAEVKEAVPTSKPAEALPSVIEKKEEIMKLAGLMVKEIFGVKIIPRVQNFSSADPASNINKPIELLQFQFETWPDRVQFKTVIDAVGIECTQWTHDNIGQPIIQIRPEVITKENIAKVREGVAVAQRLAVIKKAESMVGELNIPGLTSLIRVGEADFKAKKTGLEGKEPIEWIQFNCDTVAQKNELMRKLGVADKHGEVKSGIRAGSSRCYVQIKPDILAKMDMIAIKKNVVEVETVVLGAAKEKVVVAHGPVVPEGPESKAQSTSASPKYFDWREDSQIPLEIKSSPLWKLHELIKNQKEPPLDKAHQEVALAIMKTQLFVGQNTEWIAKMGAMHATGQMKQFLTAKSKHLDALGNGNQFERTRRDDVLRGPILTMLSDKYPNGFALAIHSVKSYKQDKFKVTALDTEGQSQEMEDHLKFGIKSEVQGFIAVAERVSKLPLADAAEVIQRMVSKVGIAETGCAAERFAEAMIETIMACDAIEQKIANAKILVSVEVILGDPPGFSQLPKNVQNAGVEFFLLNNEDEFVDAFTELLKAMPDNIQPLNSKTNMPYNLNDTDQKHNFAEALFEELRKRTKFTLSKEIILDKLGKKLAPDSVLVHSEPISPGQGACINIKNGLSQIKNQSLTWKEELCSKLQKYMDERQLDKRKKFTIFGFYTKDNKLDAASALKNALENEDWTSIAKHKGALMDGRLGKTISEALKQSKNSDGCPQDIKSLLNNHNNTNRP